MKKLKNIKLLITDVDGCLTTGQVDSLTGASTFSTLDGVGCQILRKLNIPYVAISGRPAANTTKERLSHLRFDGFYFGVANKVEVAKKLIEELNIEFDQVLFLGDDINDIPLLRRAGASLCPANATAEVIPETDQQLDSSGGNGFFRQVSEILLEAQHPGVKVFDFLENDLGNLIQ